MTPSPDNNPTTPAVDLSKNSVWAQLTKRQQDWCQSYIETHDPIESVKRTHNVKTQKSAEATAGRLLRNWKILRVLGMKGLPVEGTPLTKTEALVLMSDRLRDTKTDDMTFVRLMTEFVSLVGWGKTEAKEKDKPEPVDSFDEVLAIEQRNKHGKD
jgi:hypothetical protein